MKKDLNFWSFFLSLLSVALFFVSTSKNFFYTLSLDIGIHPLYIVLVLTIITLLLAVGGLGTASSGLLMLRSYFSIILSLGLSVIIVVVIVVAGLFAWVYRRIPFPLFGYVISCTEE